MSKFFIDQEIRFGAHTLRVVSQRSDRVHARCIDTCCSAEVRVAIAAPEKEFVKIVDNYNYYHAQTQMAETLRNIAEGPSQEQGDEDPADGWELQCRAMED